MRNLILKSRFLFFKNAGFTLIELIVVFTVMAILSVVGVASFVSYSRSQALTNDVSLLINVINQARANASSQVKANTDCVGTSFRGYRITVPDDSNNKTYGLGILCVNNSGSETLTDVSASPYSLSDKNLSFDTIYNTAPYLKTTRIKTITFSVLTNGITFTYVSGNGALFSGEIMLRGYGLTKIITVNSAGVITVTAL